MSGFILDFPNDGPEYDVNDLQERVAMLWSGSVYCAEDAQTAHQDKLAYAA